MDVLFDANTLINGIFLPHSQSRKVLDKLWSGSLRGFVCRDTLDEARGAFERAYRNTGVDLSGAFESTLVRFSLSTLPGVPQGERSLYRRVKGSGDRALVAIAKRHRLMICTNDIKDFRHASEYGVSVVTPDRLADEGGPSLERIVLGNLASEKEGTIYMVTEPNWVGMNIDKVFDKRFYFFDTEGIGGLWFDNARRSLIYEGDLGQRVELNTGTIGLKSLPLQVAVTYHCNKGVWLYFGYRERKINSEVKWVPLPLHPADRTYVGSDRLGNNQINGLIYQFTSLPTFLSETGTNNLMKGNTTAHPWERLSVEDIIRFLYGRTRIEQDAKKIASLRDEGSVSFWLRNEEDAEWPMNTKEYRFGRIRQSGLTVEACKHIDGTIELLVGGPLGRDLRFRCPVPPCDNRGLFVVINWRRPTAKLYLNAKLAEVFHDNT